MEIKKETRYTEVNENSSHFVLLLNEEVVYTGDIESIKEKIAEFVENSDETDTERFQIATYQPLLAEIDYKRSVEIPKHKVDEENEELEDEYEIHYRGRKQETFSYLDDALDHIAEMLEDDDTLALEDDVQLIRNVTYGCSYEAEVKSEVEIEFSLQPQEIEVKVVEKEPDYENMSTEDLFKLRTKINDTITRKMAFEPEVPTVTNMGVVNGEE
jgi:hypothetical protein